MITWFEEKCEELDETLNLKADASAVKDLAETIHAKANREEFVNLQSAVDKLQEFKIQHENNQIMQESYNKRLNLLIHGIQEDDKQVWEKRDVTISKFENFLKNGLKIKPDDIEVADIHRLPSTQ